MLCFECFKILKNPAQCFVTAGVFDFVCGELACWERRVAQRQDQCKQNEKIWRHSSRFIRNKRAGVVVAPIYTYITGAKMLTKMRKEGTCYAGCPINYDPLCDSIFWSFLHQKYVREKLRNWIEIYVIRKHHANKRSGSLEWKKFVYCPLSKSNTFWPIRKLKNSLKVQTFDDFGTNSN